VPDAAEIHLLVLELLHLDDLRESIDSVDERILDRLAPRARERHELLRSERLIAKEKHEVLEPRAAQRADLLL
jgi:chorismate mutase